MLPNHTTIASTLSAEDAEYITEVRIGTDSDLIGKLSETPLAAAGIVAELIRGDRVQRLEEKCRSS